MNFLKAVHENNVERVKELLDHEKLNVNMTDNHNFSGKLKKLCKKVFNEN